MILSLALIILVGLAAASIGSRLRLPRMIGMLFTGILLGPYLLDALDPSILGISSELRQLALVIILLKAGLSLELKDLQQVGRPSLLLSFVPASCEIIGITLFAPLLLPVNHLEAAIMGSVLGAVSPAVVVPRMVHLMETGYGTKKSIPQMLLAGASLDDIYVIVLFTTFVGMARGGHVEWTAFAGVPLSIVLGILLGIAVGYVLSAFFEWTYHRALPIRNSLKVILLFGLSCLLLAGTDLLQGRVPISGLLAIMSMAATLRARAPRLVADRLSEKYGKLWLAAEIFLFVLVGAAVDIRYTLQAGLPALLLLFIGLSFRSVGVQLCLLGTRLNKKERLYCALAYLPKATVQAAIGAVPLSLGLACGPIVLSVAVLSILVTAPLGAFSMDALYRRLLTKESGEQEPLNALTVG